MRVGCLAQPGKLRQVADGFSTGRPRAVRRQAAQRCKQQQPTFLDTEAAVLHKHLTGKRSVRSSMSHSKSALSLLKRLHGMVLGVPALIAWHTLAARASVPTPAIQAIARR